MNAQLGAARDFVINELHRMGARHIVLSTDIPIRRDGLFYATSAQPNDPGVAAHFQWRGKPFAVACDSYRRLWENVRAIGKTIEALRTIERHGASQLLERAVSGFAALPPGEDAGEVERPWWEVLGMPMLDGMSPIEIAGDPKHPMRTLMLKMAEAIYKVKVPEAHPDRGGSNDVMWELNLAIEAARRSLS